MKKSMKAKPKTSRLTIILISIIAVLLIVMGIVIYFLLHKDEKNDTKDDRPTVVTQDNVDEVIADMDKPIDDGTYEVTMNTDWLFNSDTSNAYVENSTNNTRTVYFDVNLADTGELVYSSPYIPVGEKIQNFVLDSKLSPGKYNGLVTYHLVDDNKKEVSNLSVTVTFQVK